MTALDAFHQQQYLNLETFRKSGVGVKTPVWFVREGDTLFVRTVADSGKVKRIRNNARVNIAPCKADGALLGEWIPALARELTDEETDRMVNRLLDRKYGLVKKMFGLVSTIQGRKGTILAIKLVEEELRERAQRLTKWPNCEKCGKKLESKGFEARQLTGLIGTVRWGRRQGRCPDRCQIGQVAPLDTELGLQPNQRTSAELKRRRVPWLSSCPLR